MWIRRFIIITLVLFFVLQIQAQPFRYSETIFNETDTLINVEYARADWLNNHISLAGDIHLHAGEVITENRPLYMDIFSPKNDTVTKRPAIIFAHSGGFLLGSRKNDDMLALCDSFARRGYVTATIDYRLGMGATVSTFFGIIIHVKVSKTNTYRSVYRATQDSRAAIRFLKHNAEIYGIDSSKIYMAGSSAGGFVALHNVYLNNENEIPTEILDEPFLGNLDTIGIPGLNSNPAAAVSLWGALESPGLIENNNTPLLLVHGENDDVVPFKKGIPLETLVPDNPALEYLMDETYGSYCIDTALNNRGITHETYFVAEKGHEFYGVNTGQFSAEGPNEYWDKIQLKISDFFYSQFRPEADFEFEVNGKTVSFYTTSSNNYFNEWNIEDENIQTGNNVDFTFSAPGDYKIQLKTCNWNLACDTISKTITIETPVFTRLNEWSKFKIYPNPVSTQLFIEGIQNYSNISVFNISGQKQLVKNNLKNSYIDVSQLKNGIYILEIENKGFKYHQKFLKKN